MPETITLADGSEREVLTTEEQQALSDKAAKVDTVEQTHGEALKNLRNHTKELEKQLKEKGVTVKSIDGEDKITPEDVEATTRKIVQETEAKKLEKYREKRITELAGGDENKKKVIEEKLHRAIGDKIITDQEELEDYLSDAAYLANKNSDSSITNPVHKSGGEPTGTPIRGNSQTRTRGVEIAGAFGYGIKNKDLINK